MDATRRNLMTTASAAVIAVALAGCGSSTIDIIGTLAQFYQKVQKGVADACAAAGKLVPTIDAIMAITAQVIGAALNNDTLPKAVAAVQTVIDNLVKQCPTPPPAGTVRAAPSPTVTHEGKEVPVFY